MSDKTDLTVLKFLAQGRTLVWTATATDQVPKDVRAVAKAHGGCRSDGTIDPALCAYAAVELAQRCGVTIPTREPAPAPARPAPAVKRVAAPVAAHAAGTSAAGDVLQEVPLDRLKTDDTNPRENVGDVTELAASMREVGLLQPIVARRSAGEQLFVVAGHRRLAAAHSLGWKSVAVVVRRDMRPDEVLAAMLIENGQRKDLDAIEEARGLARLKGQLGCSEIELARRVGRSNTSVSNRLRLLSLPVEEQEALRDGQMTLGEATQRAKLASGRVRSGPRGMPHLSTMHPLAAAAKARCLRLAHGRGKGQGVGGIACGECWESVIRADERSGLHQRSGATGKCALCDRALPAGTTTPAPKARRATA